MKRAGFLYEKLLDRELIRDAIIKTTDTEARLVDDYCDAKSRMFHYAQR